MIFKNSLLNTVKPWFCLSSSDVKSDPNIYFWAAFWYTPNKFVIYLLCGSRKYPYHPLQKGSDFRGGSIYLIFQWGGGCTIGKYFQRVLVTRKRVTKKKNTKIYHNKNTRKVKELLRNSETKNKISSVSPSRHCSIWILVWLQRRLFRCELSVWTCAQSPERPELVPLKCHVMTSELFITGSTTAQHIILWPMVSTTF